MLVIDLFDGIEYCIEKNIDFWIVLIHWSRVDDEANSLKPFDLLDGFGVAAKEEPCETHEDILVSIWQNESNQLPAQLIH